MHAPCSTQFGQQDVQAPFHKRSLGLLTTLGRSLACGVFDLALPPHCAICGAATAAEEGSLCSSCWASVEAPAPGTCIRCAAPLPREVALCGGCDGPIRAFDAAFFLLPFRGVARQAVHLFKYGNKPGLATALGRRLGEAVVTAFAESDRPLAEGRGSSFDPPTSSGLRIAAGAFDLVVPVPLTRRRLAERGYNQAERIAYGVVERTGWPLDRRSLVRIHWRGSQTALDGADRLANVADAFEVGNPERLAGARVLLVDDVVTTGATVGACRESLVGAGAASVTVAAVAYAGSVDMDVPEPEAIAELKRDF